MCSSPVKESSTSVEFGSQEAGSFCGNVEPDGKSLTNLEEYTKFFNDRGGSRDANWNLNTSQDQGTKSCMEQRSSSQGLIHSSGTDTQYLGFCDDSDVANTKFVKKTKEWKTGVGEGGLTVSICDKDCGAPENDVLAGSARSFQSEGVNSKNGKKVQFYKN